MIETVAEEELVTPGEVLGTGTQVKAGRGAYLSRDNNTVYASLTGRPSLIPPSPESPDQAGMDQEQRVVEQSVNILTVAHKSCSEFLTPTKNSHIHETPNVDVGLVTPTPQKTEETVNNRCKKESAILFKKQAMDQNPYKVKEVANISPGAHKSCLKFSTSTKKLHEITRFDANLVSPTSEKTEETVNNSCKKELAELPEKYKLLSELFNRMTTSLRLLNLRKQSPTFQNIRRVVEALTWRKFSYKNLAQIKFILPEAVQTDKILLHNKQTLCMEPDIKVTLLFDVVEGHSEHSDYIALSRLIFSRLFKFVNEHSEDYDVPEAELPAPFNRKDITVSANTLPMNSSVKILPNLDDKDVTEPLNPSHLPPSFKRHFSAETFKTKLSQSLAKSPIKEMSFSTCLDPVKQEKAFEVANEYTPMKNPLVVNEIIVETPNLSTPKRSVGSEDNKLKSMVNQKTMGNSLFAKRILDFSRFDEENALLDGNFTSDSGPSAKH